MENVIFMVVQVEGLTYMHPREDMYWYFFSKTQYFSTELAKSYLSWSNEAPAGRGRRNSERGC